MATPYFQLTFDSVASTQDVARDALEDLPVLVIAASQTEGRGRTGNEWQTAPRAVSVSYAFHHRDGDHRPLSLMAGVAVVRATAATQLKWPNDVVADDSKLGGILVERSGDITVIGFGLNLWWPDAPPGIGALKTEDPKAMAHVEIGGLWGAEMARLIDQPGWPIDEYRASCVTLGQRINWVPDGVGNAVDVAEDGALIVDTPSGSDTLRSGAVSHVRTAG